MVVQGIDLVPGNNSDGSGRVVRVLSYVRYKSSPANGIEGSRRKRPQGYERQDQQDYPSEGVN